MSSRPLHYSNHPNRSAHNELKVPGEKQYVSCCSQDARCDWHSGPELEELSLQDRNAISTFPSLMDPTGSASAGTAIKLSLTLMVKDLYPWL